MDMQRIYVINQECSDDFRCSLWIPCIASFIGDKISTYMVFIVKLKDKTNACICSINYLSCFLVSGTWDHIQSQTSGYSAVED